MNDTLCTAPHLILVESEYGATWILGVHQLAVRGYPHHLVPGAVRSAAAHLGALPGSIVYAIPVVAQETVPVPPPALAGQGE